MLENQQKNLVFFTADPVLIVLFKLLYFSSSGFLIYEYIWIPDRQTLYVDPGPVKLYSDRIRIHNIVKSKPYIKITGIPGRSRGYDTAVSLVI
jgi:hypothetical protein